MEAIQLLNTAVLKSKERRINIAYEERLKKVCQAPAIEALNKAIVHLSDSKRISRDQAAIELIETIRELDSVWGDYVMMEGIDRLKASLRQNAPS